MIMKKRNINNYKIINLKDLIKMIEMGNHKNNLTIAINKNFIEIIIKAIIIINIRIILIRIKNFKIIIIKKEILIEVLTMIVKIIIIRTIETIFHKKDKKVKLLFLIRTIILIINLKKIEIIIIKIKIKIINNKLIRKKIMNGILMRNKVNQKRIINGKRLLLIGITIIKKFKIRQMIISWKIRMKIKKLVI